MSAPAAATPAALTLDSPDLTNDQYRALREGKTIDAPAPPAETVNPSESAATSDTADENEELQETSTEQPTETPKPGASRLNQRFAELTSEIKTLRAQLASRPAPQAEQPSQPKPGQSTAPAASSTAAVADDPEPVADKYTDYLQWQKDYTAWVVRQEGKKLAAAAETQRRQTEAQTRATAWAERVTNATKKYADFPKVAQNPDLPVTPLMADVITDSEHGTEILYWLGQNPTEAERISRLSPIAAARAIGVIESRVSAQNGAGANGAGTTEDSQEPAISKAPRPIRPVSSSNAGRQNLTSDEALKGMSTSEYRAYREAGKIK